MRKLYIVDCDNEEIYDKFVEIIQVVPNTILKKYNGIIFDNLNRLYDMQLHRLNEDDYKFGMKLIKVLSLRNIPFKWLITYIHDKESPDTKMFILLNNKSIKNKLTRYIKRPNYITIKLVNIDEIYNHSDKYDIKIIYINDVDFRIQVKKFMISKIPNLNRIRL